jgi:hypothetical protein
MSSRLRGLLLAWIAACQVYLFAHSQEPLRLDIGDPWSDANVLCSINYVKEYGFLETSFTDVLDVGPLTKDSYHYTHYPPLAEITYGAIGKYLGVSTIGIYRLFALLFSAGAMAMFFLYTRRMYGETIALVGTALWQGSLLWLMYADSIHQAPIFQLTTFLGLWGLERAIATKEKRFYLAAAAGAFGCFLTSYDGWIFFPSGVLFTIYAKSGNPFARGNRHYILICAAGCIAALAAKAAFVTGAVGWHEFVADLRFQFLERSGSTFERAFTSAVPTMTRRFTQVFSPLIWIAIAYHGIRAVRAPSVAYALRETGAWLLACGLLFVYVFTELAASQLLPSQVMLPFYAIGSAMIIEKLLAGRLRVLAYAWLVFAAAWGAVFMVRIPRSVMATDQLATIHDYLDKHDKNDFVLNNLMASGQIQWAFDRHDFAVYAGTDVGPDAAYGAQLYMYSMFEETNTTEVSAIIFKGPESRYLDKSLWPLALPPHLWSVAGAPYFWRAKSEKLINEYDHKIMVGLKSVGAERVVTTDDIDVYRIDRRTVMKLLGDAVPERQLMDVTGASATPMRLLGWSSTVEGWRKCPHTDGAACKSVLTKRGITIPDAKTVREAQLMVRIPTACELKLRIRLAAKAPFGLRVGDFHQQLAPTDDATITVPHAVAGINILTFEAHMGAIERASFSPGVQIRTVEVLSCTPSM